MSTPTRSPVTAEGAESPRAGSEEASVAARRIEHPHRPVARAGDRERVVDRAVDDEVDQVVGRVPGAQLLARAPRRFRRRHTASVGSGAVPDRFLRFDRDEWAELRAATPMTLREPDLARLRGINDHIDLDEVAAVYLPLSRLLNLYVSATQDLHKVSATFLGTIAPKVPYIIGVAGSVAVGKSTFARILQALLARWPDHPKVDLITTDGFLHPNAVLDERGIMNRKGFPERYDTRRLLRFLRQIKSGDDDVEAPVYSHVVYDIVDGGRVTCHQPDIVILEGLNVLQAGDDATEFVSDYFDFSIYLDAEEDDIEQWYIERFLTLRESVFQDPESFFRHFAELDDEEAVDTAAVDLAEINGRQPAREHPPDPRAGVADRAQDGRPPRRRGPAAPALTVALSGRGPDCATFRRRAEPGGEVGDRRQFDDVLVVVVDALEFPDQVVRDVHGVPPIASTGRMSLRTELPTMQNRSGSTPTWRSSRR